MARIGHQPRSQKTRDIEYHDNVVYAALLKYKLPLRFYAPLFHVNGQISPTFGQYIVLRACPLRQYSLSSPIISYLLSCTLHQKVCVHLKPVQINHFHAALMTLFMREDQFPVSSRLYTSHLRQIQISV